MSKDFKAIIRGAKLPETTVPVCLHADLVAEFEQASRELAEAQRSPLDSLAGTGMQEIAQRIENLRTKMGEHTIDFRLRGMPRSRWKAFIADHPPRKDESGAVDERDKYIGVNTNTFGMALVRLSVVDPDLDDEDWRILLGDTEAERARREAAGEPVEDGKLTDRQFDELSNAAWGLNRGEVDIPFSPAASRILNSAPG
jgi:hypothetical protein